jgi:hypothetical protein
MIVISPTSFEGKQRDIQTVNTCIPNHNAFQTHFKHKANKIYSMSLFVKKASTRLSTRFFIRTGLVVFSDCPHALWRSKRTIANSPIRAQPFHVTIGKQIVISFKVGRRQRACRLHNTDGAT